MEAPDGKCPITEFDVEYIGFAFLPAFFFAKYSSVDGETIMA